MFAYIGLFIILAGVVPTLCYFGGFIDLYLQFGAPFSGLVIMLWLVIDISKMRHTTIREKSHARHHSSSTAK